MPLKSEAAAMLAAGFGLVAQETTAWSNGETQTRLRPTIARRAVRSDGTVCYEVVDYRHGLEGRVQSFSEPARAAATFQQLVGRSAMSKAVAHHRYAFLFPKGSSLEWDPPRRRPTRAQAQAA